MIRFACIFAAVGLAAAGSTALAANPQPALMTDAQMDDVTAGALGDGVLTIVFQDSFNNLTVNFGSTKGAKAPHPGNGHANGQVKGVGNPHSAANAASSSDTMMFQLNIVANVNAAIAGGDASAGQVIGTQTITAIVPTSTLAAAKK